MRSGTFAGRGVKNLIERKLTPVTTSPAVFFLGSFVLTDATPTDKLVKNRL